MTPKNEVDEEIGFRRWWMIRRRFPEVSTTTAAFVTIVVIALLAVGIGWLVFRS